MDTVHMSLKVESSRLSGDKCEIKGSG